MSATAPPSVYSIVLNSYTNDSRVRKQAESLSANGYKVTVVAMWDEGLERAEICNGVQIKRIRLSSRNWLRILPVQILKYLEFIVRALFVVRNGHYLQCNDLDALSIGYLAKLLLGGEKTKLKLIYDAHELETEVYGLSGFKQKAAKFLERNMIGKVDATMTVCDSIADIYSSVYAIERPVVVRNIPKFEPAVESTMLRDLHGIPLEKFIFITQGMLSRGRGLEALIEIAERSQDKPFVIVFMGKGELEQKIKDKAATCENIIFQPFVKSEEITQYTSSADCGIAFFEDICLSNHYSLPNKMFEYMMAEIPIIVSDLPEMRKFVLETGTGYTADDRSILDLMGAMFRIMGNDQAEFKKNLQLAKLTNNWENEEEKLLSVYSNA